MIRRTKSSCSANTAKALKSQQFPKIPARNSKFITNICHSKYLPYTQRPKPKGHENWSPEETIFASALKKQVNIGPCFLVDKHIWPN